MHMTNMPKAKKP